MADAYTSTHVTRPGETLPTDRFPNLGRLAPARISKPLYLPMAHSFPAEREQFTSKFYPPRIDAGTTLFRPLLVEEILGDAASSCKAIVIEAQAGQGKSTLAIQFLHHFGLRFCWHQVGPEDGDPALLLSSLLDNLSRRLPGFTSYRLAEILRQEELDSIDIIHCANILLTDLDLHLADDLYIVFDDLHLAEQLPLFNGLLSHIIDTSPPRLHFLLISRRPLALTAKALRQGTDFIMLANHHLCFTLKEVEDLFATVLQSPISKGQAEEIRQQTRGWIMGILLATRGKSATENDVPAPTGRTRIPTDLSTEQILAYFRGEILAQLPKELHTHMMQLSLLDSIPVELSINITGREEMGAILTDLMLDNFFLYPLDEYHREFRFHHLFQEFLQEQTRRHLSEKEINNTYRIAAAHYLHRGSIVQALGYYQKSANYPLMEEILRREGLKLIARNRTVSLLRLLATVPADQLQRHAWLSFFTAILHSDTAPKKALPLLESSCRQFIAAGDQIGELLCLVHLIYYHFVVSGMYQTGATLLERAEELFLIHRDSLPLQARILSARHLAAGFTFFCFDLDKGQAYSHLARDLALEHDIRNGIAASRFTCGYCHSFRNDFAGCLREIELALPLLHDPLVSVSNKLTLRVLHLNTLCRVGDTVNFFHQLHLLRNSIHEQLVRQTLAAPYAYIWGSICLLQDGRSRAALDLLQKGMQHTETAHARSQFLQWSAYARTLIGETGSVNRDIEEALRLREIAGGPYYALTCLIICGAALLRAKDTDQARLLLDRAMQEAGEINSKYLHICAAMQRAWLWKTVGDEKALHQDLETGLTLLEKIELTDFWGNEPVMLAGLLDEAARAGIRPAMVGLLAKKHLGRAYPPGAGSLPLLRITILAPFAMTAGNRNILGIEALTPAQRQFMATLLAAKNQRISQENMQLLLWPDSPPKKTRAKLDTLIRRLRQVLDTHLHFPAPASAACYLKMQKGIIFLDNCIIDGEDFARLAGEGLHHMQQENFWQAGNAFYQALQLWDSTAAHSDLFLGESGSYYDRLCGLLAKIGQRYTVILAESNSVEEAIEVVTKVLCITPMEDRLITLLYSLYLRAGKMLKAKELLQHYRQSLRDQEYSQDEIDELLFTIATAGTTTSAG